MMPWLESLTVTVSKRNSIPKIFCSYVPQLAKRFDFGGRTGHFRHPKATGVGWIQTICHALSAGATYEDCRTNECFGLLPFAITNCQSVLPSETGDWNSPLAVHVQLSIRGTEEITLASIPLLSRTTHALHPIPGRFTSTMRPFAHVVAASD